MTHEFKRSSFQPFKGKKISQVWPEMTVSWLGTIPSFTQGCTRTTNSGEGHQTRGKRKSPPRAVGLHTIYSVRKCKKKEREKVVTFYTNVYYKNGLVAPATGLSKTNNVGVHSATSL